MSRSLAYRHYTRALAQWPEDILRPDVSFPKTMQQRIGSHLLPSAIHTPKNIIADSALATVPFPKQIDEKGELEQVNALYSLLENRYTKKYPLSEHLMKPKSNPAYYEDLIRELKEAPTRSWLTRQLKKWKGFLRLT